MIEQEIIQKWKENTSAFGLMPKEMQDWAKVIAGTNFERYDGHNNWPIKSGSKNSFCDDYVYRLRPDYQPPKPEPKIVKCEISAGQFDKLGYETRAGVFEYTNSLVSSKNFSHFEKANGNKIDIENIATEIRNGGKVWVCFEESE
jgi:hypothetical protein